MRYIITTRTMPDQYAQNQISKPSNAIQPQSILLHSQANSSHGSDSSHIKHNQSSTQSTSSDQQQHPSRKLDPAPVSNVNNNHTQDPKSTSGQASPQSNPRTSFQPSGTQLSQSTDPSSTSTLNASSGSILNSKLPFPQPNPITQPQYTSPLQGQPYPAPKPAQDPYGWDDWGYGNDQLDDFSSGMNGQGGLGTGAGYYGNPQMQPQSSNQQPKRLTPEERVEMIESVYQEILCRKPDTRDINYYKYSTLNEDQIKKQLISSAEHKDTMNRGREYSKLKEHAEQLETRVRMLEGQIKDQVEEFRELTNLLQEKNRHLQLMRTSGMPGTLSRGGDFTYAESQQQPPINRTVEVSPQPRIQTNDVPTHPINEQFSPDKPNLTPSMLRNQPPADLRTPSQFVPSHTTPQPITHATTQTTPISQQIQPSSNPNAPSDPIMQPYPMPTQEIFTDQTSATFMPPDTPATPSSTDPSESIKAKNMLNSFIHRIL